MEEIFQKMRTVRTGAETRVAAGPYTTDGTFDLYTGLTSDEAGRLRDFVIGPLELGVLHGATYEGIKQVMTPQQLADCGFGIEDKTGKIRKLTHEVLTLPHAYGHFLVETGTTTLLYGYDTRTNPSNPWSTPRVDRSNFRTARTDNEIKYGYGKVGGQ